MIPAAEKNLFFRLRAEELSLALGLLTRFPLPSAGARTNASLGTAFWAFPLAGALVGAPAAALFWLSISVGFSTVASVLIAMAATLVASGAFHEDGLTDFWDGIGGGATRDAKLAIMRDSRIGTYGALALSLTLGLQISFLVSIHYYAGTAVTMGAIIAAEALGRGAAALPVVILDPARQDGLGVSMAGLPAGALVGGVAVAVLLPLLLLGGPSAAFILGGVVGAAAISLVARSYLGGYTGDVLGAAIATARMAALGALLLMVTP